MSTVTVELPDSLSRRIEELADQRGFSVHQFLISAAGEKLSAMLSAEFLHEEAARGCREHFETYLDAVPDVPPIPGDEMH